MAQRLERESLGGHLPVPSAVPAPWCRHSQRKTPTVALQRLVARSRSHVIPQHVGGQAERGRHDDPIEAIQIRHRTDGTTARYMGVSIKHEPPCSQQGCPSRIRWL